MNLMGLEYRKKTRKPKKKKEKEKSLEINYLMNRKEWLKNHPEDQPLDDENMAARRKGYDDDGMRQLFAAMCLRACIDYKKAVQGAKVGGYEPEKIIYDCHEFFGSDIFQFFTNGMKVSEIEKTIRSTPKDAIHNIWHRIDDRAK